MKALDLFCKAGGATKGLQRAGFHVTGVDIEAQRHYCGDEFVRSDALTFPLEGYDFIWASPPCQAYCLAAKSQRNSGKKYPALIPQVRDRLKHSKTPWVIENTPGAPLRVDLTICGCQVGLQLRRVRWFEASWPITNTLPPHKHNGPVVSVVGHGTPSWVRAKLGRCPTIVEYRAAMGINWMNRDELSQAIPPAYSQYIAEQWLASERELGKK